MLGKLIIFLRHKYRKAADDTAVVTSQKKALLTKINQYVFVLSI